MNSTQPEQAEAYLLEAKEVVDDLEEIALRLTTLCYLEQERFDQVLVWQNEEVETVVTGGTLLVPWLP